MSTPRTVKILGKEYTEEELANHETFCSLPWMHIHTWPDGNVYPCCQADFQHPTSHYKGETLNELANTENMKQIRVDMLNGKKPMKYCSYCFNNEDKFGVESSRQLRTTQFLEWDFEQIKPILESTKEDGEIDFKLLYYDIRYSNVCNLKCRTCGPSLSSSWASEVLTKGPGVILEYPDIKKNGIININDISGNIFKEIMKEETLQGFRSVYFAGGETLVTKEHYDVLEGLVKVGNTDIILLYNTNFTKLKYAGRDILDLWEKFPCLNVGTSIDDVGHRVTYTRGGASWDDIVNNFKRFHERIPNSKDKIYNSITVSIFNVFYLPEIVEAFYNEGLVYKENRWSMKLNLVFGPEYYCVSVLPPDVKKIVQEKLESFFNTFDFQNDDLRKSFLGNIQHLVDLMNSKDDSHLLPKTAMNVKIIDDRRGESFANTFPELNEHLQLEKYLDKEIIIRAKK